MKDFGLQEVRNMDILKISKENSFRISFSKQKDSSKLKFEESFKE